MPVNRNQGPEDFELIKARALDTLRTAHAFFLVTAEGEVVAIKGGGMPTIDAHVFAIAVAHAAGKLLGETMV